MNAILRVSHIDQTDVTVIETHFDYVYHETKSFFALLFLAGVAVVTPQTPQRCSKSVSWSYIAVREAVHDN